MLQRPKVGETEEDLLEQEEEFLRQSGAASTQKRNPEVNPDAGPSTSAASRIVGEVVERDQGSSNEPGDGDEARGLGFPALFEVDPNLPSDSTGKKSLFARLMEDRGSRNNTGMEVDLPGPSTERTATNVESGVKPEDVSNNPGSMENNDVVQESNMATNEEPDVSNNPGSMENNDVVQESNVATNEEPQVVSNAPQNMRDSNVPRDVVESLNIQSLTRLSRMSEAAILEAQRKLYETMSPELVAILKYRARTKEEAERNESQNQGSDFAEGGSLFGDDQVKETLAEYVGDKWINMDFLEKEKLQWVGDIPRSKCLEPDKPYSARFNFKGELQPFITEIDVTNALYHHGEEPERPGYTIQELYQLARSAIPQQRRLALNTLANIVHKAKLGYYDSCFDGHLLRKLLEADLFLLLRYSIDENPLIPAAMNCLRKLLYNDSDEYCLNRLMGVTNHDMQPLLFHKIDADREEERELADNVIIQCDLIKGAMRTDLLERITYILNNIKCDRITIANAFMCIIRIARHSTEACLEIVKNTDLLNFVYSSINCLNPIYQGVKLFGLLIGHSQEMAEEIYFKYDMGFLISYLNYDSMSELTNKEFFLLKLECINLWKNFIRFEYMVEDFLCWTPCCIRILEFYVEKVDIYSESDFDFEMFATLISLLRLCVRDGHPVDVRYQDTVAICLEKWMKQLLHSEDVGYAGMKALGSCFSYFDDFFGFYEIDDISYTFITRLNEIIMSVIPTPGFSRLTTRLAECSHILAVTAVKRDSSNLPSLCSVYKNGNDFVKILDERSTFPFFIPFAKYLKFSFSVLPEARINVKMFLHCPSVRKYITQVIKLYKHTDNWFNQYETGFLTDILYLCSFINDELTLKLGFRLLPMLRVDDENFKSVLSVITDKKTWSADDDFFDSLTDVFLEYLYKPVAKPNFVLPYKNELPGDDWAYKILTLSRGKDAVVEVGKVLKFTWFILCHNPQLLERISYTSRYYHLCVVFLTDQNVFDDDIQKQMRNNFDCIMCNRDKVNLEIKVDRKKSFYDLYTELITQYAAVSYGLPIFAELVVFPLQNRFNPAYRKLLWFEYHHALRVITLSYPAEEFIDLKDFVEPYERDESLLLAYLDSISKNVILKSRNAFVYNVATSNLKSYMRYKNKESRFFKRLAQKICSITNETTKQDLIL